MATYRIPNNDLIRQLNIGDIRGELWATKNLDLATSPGKIKLARPTQQILSDGEISGNVLQAALLFNSRIYAFTDDNAYSDNTPYNAFTEVAAVNTNTAQDAVVFDGQIRIAQGTDIARFNGSGSFANNWWTGDIGGENLTSDVPHVMEVLRASGRDTLAITDGNRLRYYNAAAGHTSFTWDANLIGCCQASGLNAGWVGTYNTTGTNAEVISWQVGNDQYTQAYPVNAKAVLAMAVVNNVPIIITERGEIQRFNQAGFSTFATLPLWNELVFLSDVETGIIQSSNTGRPIHPKGMQVAGDKLLVYVNTRAVSGGGNVSERAPGGVYEVDLITGSVSHRAAPNNYTQLTASSPLLVVNDSNSRMYFGGTLDDIDNSRGFWRENLSADAANTGYLVTTEMHSASVEEFYKTVLVSALKDADHTLTVKFRDSKTTTLPLETDVTWLDETTFNTTTDLSAVADTFSSDPSNTEVEFLTNTGVSQCLQVSSITVSANTYSIKISDSTIGVAGATSRVRFDRWTEIADPYDDDSLFKTMNLGQGSPVVQLKVIFEGANGYPELHRLVTYGQNKKPLK